MSNYRPGASQPKGLFGRIQAVILQPISFFQGLPQIKGGWLGAALLILLLNGISAVQRGAAEDISGQIVMAVMGAAPLLLAWIGQTLVLSIAPMLRGYAPQLGLNWRVAVWASIPFALLALLQIAYIAAGGMITAPGVASVVTDIPGYEDFSDALQILLRQTAAHLTLFDLWNLVLLTLGTKYSLSAKWWGALLAVFCWMIAALFIPAFIEIAATA